MRRAKKSYLLAITLVIAGLMITTSISTMGQQNNTTAPEINVVKNNAVPHTITAQTIQAASPVIKTMPKTLAGTPVFIGDGNQKHAGFARTLTGVQLAAFRDDAYNNGQIIYTFSTDDGASYDPGVYFQNDNDGDYPSLKYWGASTYYGTMVTNYNDLSGAPTYLFGCTDPADTSTYSLLYWDWSTYGWHDMIDADIACDNSQESHEWGLSAYVTSSTYTNGGEYPDGYTNGPTVTFADPDDPNQGFISWFYEYDNCMHTDVDIDHVTKLGYIVYDQVYQGSTRLVVREKDFIDVAGDYAHDFMYNITTTANLSYPAIAAFNGKIVLLVEKEQSGNKDIVCLYGTNVTTLQTSVVVASAENEMYPDVRFVQGTTFQCTFIKNGKLYKSLSDDAGATWSSAEEIGDCVPEYKSADLSEYGVKALYDVNNGQDIDVYLTDVGEGPLYPTLGITFKTGFGVGVSATVLNSGTAAATNVKWEIIVTGGILGRINKIVNSTISTMAIDGEEQVKTGMIFGLGTVDIKATAVCDEGVAIGPISATGTQFAIFTIVK